MSAPRDALTEIKRARSALIVSQPFWGCLSAALRLVERPDVETMATDGESLFFNPAFALSLPQRELIGVLAHEVEHVARLHCLRRGSRDPRLWNIACDLAINESLRAAGFHLPKGALFDARYKGRSAEQIYKALAREEAQQPRQTQPQGAGQGAPDPGACGGVLDSPVPEAQRGEAEAEIQTRVRQAAAVARRAGAGVTPGAVTETLDSLGAGRVSWREILRKFADESSLRESSWLRRSRRSSGAIILPGNVSASPAHLVCIVDTSASMDRRALQAIGAELQAILDEQGAERLTLIQCDTRVRAAQTYLPGDVLNLDIAGRGGTAFAPAFAYVADEHPDASAIIYLTDLDCDSWGDEPACPVLWAATERPRPVPWGEVVEIDEHA